MHPVIKEAQEFEGRGKMSVTKLILQELGATSHPGSGVAVDGWTRLEMRGTTLSLKGSDSVLQITAKESSSLSREGIVARGSGSAVYKLSMGFTTD